MSLILAAISGIMGLNVLLEFRKRSTGGEKRSFATAKSMPSGWLMQRGKWKAFSFTNPVWAIPTSRL